MMKFKFVYIFIYCLVFLIVACNRGEKKTEILHQLSTLTYSDELTIEGTVEAVRSKTVFCPNNLEGTILYLVEDGTMVEKGTTLCILENRELSNYYDQVVQRVEQTNGEYTKSKANLDLQYALLEAQVKSNEAQTSITNLDSAQLQYASPVQQKITKLEMQKTAIEKAKIEKKLGYLKTINESELKKLKLQIARDSNRAENINSMLKSMKVVAPESGLALRSGSPFRDEKLVEGDQVWEGIALVTIPDMTEMKVKIFASESDYKRIEVNNKVTYTFSSMPGNKAFGKILLKAPMGVPINRDSKIKHFEITASVDSFDVIPEPGISATCVVTLKEIADTIVVPQLAIFDEDSSKFVFVKARKEFEKKEVLLGENSPKMAIVIAGLQGNEQVSFVRPEASKIAKTVFLPDSLKKNLSTQLKVSTSTDSSIKKDQPMEMKIPSVRVRGKREN